MKKIIIKNLETKAKKVPYIGWYDDDANEEESFINFINKLNIEIVGEGVLYTKEKNLEIKRFIEKKFKNSDENVKLKLFNQISEIIYNKLDPIVVYIDKKESYISRNDIDYIVSNNNVYYVVPITSNNFAVAKEKLNLNNKITKLVNFDNVKEILEGDGVVVLKNGEKINIKFHYAYVINAKKLKKEVKDIEKLLKGEIALPTWKVGSLVEARDLGLNTFISQGEWIYNPNSKFLKIDKEYIREIGKFIGKGGKNIKAIQEKIGVKIRVI